MERDGLSTRAWSEPAAQLEALRREVERLSVLSTNERGLLDAILNHSPHGILVCDANGKMTVQNRAAERIWAGSATAASVAGWAAYRAYHPNGRPYEAEDWAMARCLTHGEIVHAHEVFIERFDGSKGVLLGSCAPIYDNEGLITGAVAVFADITRFKDLEADLRQAHADTALLYGLTDAVVRSTTVEEIFDHAIDAVLTCLHVDRAAILVFDEAQVMRFRAWRDLSPAYRAAVDGHSPWSADACDPPAVVIPDVGKDPSFAGYADTFAADNIRALAFIPLLHKGKLLGKFMVYSATPRHFSERDIRLALTIGSQVAHGISRRDAEQEVVRLLEETKAAQSAAEQAVRTRDELLAIVSHDLRNPVNTLTLATSLLMAQAAQQQDQKLRLQAQRMQRALGTMERLIGDLLDMAAIDAQALQVNAQPTDLGGIIDHAVDLLRPLADERGQKFVVRVPKGEFVLADSERIVQVLSNIAGNAIKHTPMQGTIEIVGQLSVVDGKRWIEISVVDHGQGIAPEHLPRVFERFWRPKQDRQGVGLGLAIAKGVVHAHGGAIYAENNIHGGATFRFTIPSA